VFLSFRTLVLLSAEDWVTSGWRFENRGIRLGVEAAGDPFFLDLDSRSLVGAGEGEDKTSLSSGCDGQSSERESSHACPMVAVFRDDG